MENFGSSARDSKSDQPAVEAFCSQSLCKAPVAVPMPESGARWPVICEACKTRLYPVDVFEKLFDEDDADGRGVLLVRRGGGLVDVREAELVVDLAIESAPAGPSVQREPWRSPWKVGQFVVARPFGLARVEEIVQGDEPGLLLDCAGVGRRALVAVGSIPFGSLREPMSPEEAAACVHRIASAKPSTATEEERETALLRALGESDARDGIDVLADAYADPNPRLLDGAARPLRMELLSEIAHALEQDAYELHRDLLDVFGRSAPPAPPVPFEPRPRAVARRHVRRPPRGVPTPGDGWRFDGSFEAAHALVVGDPIYVGSLRDGYEQANIHVRAAHAGAWYCWIFEMAEESHELLVMAVLEGTTPDPARVRVNVGPFRVDSGGAAIVDRTRREQPSPREAALYGPRNGPFDGGWARSTGGDGIFNAWVDDPQTATHIVIDGWGFEAIAAEASHS